MNGIYYYSMEPARSADLLPKILLADQAPFS